MNLPKDYTFKYTIDFILREQLNSSQRRRAMKEIPRFLGLSERQFYRYLKAPREAEVFNFSLIALEKISLWFFKSFHLRITPQELINFKCEVLESEGTLSFAEVTSPLVD